MSFFNRRIKYSTKYSANALSSRHEELEAKLKELSYMLQNSTSFPEIEDSRDAVPLAQTEYPSEISEYAYTLAHRSEPNYFFDELMHTLVRREKLDVLLAVKKEMTKSLPKTWLPVSKKLDAFYPIYPDDVYRKSDMYRAKVADSIAHLTT